MISSIRTRSQDQNTNVYSSTHYREYSLNKRKALNKKVEASNRPSIQHKYNKSNYTFIVNAGVYESIKSKITSHFINIRAIAQSVVDENGTAHTNTFKARNKYTVNLYPTSSTIVVNGSKPELFLPFLRDILMTIDKNYVNKINDILQQLNPLDLDDQQRKKATQHPRSQIIPQTQVNQPTDLRRRTRSRKQTPNALLSLQQSKKKPSPRRQTNNSDVRNTTNSDNSDNDNDDTSDNDDTACNYCNLPVKRADSALACDQCEEWVHLNCDPNINDSLYNQHQEDTDLPYLCMNCVVVNDIPGPSPKGKTDHMAIVNPDSTVKTPTPIEKSTINTDVITNTHPVDIPTPSLAQLAICNSVEPARNVDPVQPSSDQASPSTEPPAPEPPTLPLGPSVSDTQAHSQELEDNRKDIEKKRKELQKWEKELKKRQEYEKNTLDKLRASRVIISKLEYEKLQLERQVSLATTGSGCAPCHHQRQEFNNPTPKEGPSAMAQNRTVQASCTNNAQSTPELPHSPNIPPGITHPPPTHNMHTQESLITNTLPIPHPTPQTHMHLQNTNHPSHHKHHCPNPPLNEPPSTPQNSPPPNFNTHTFNTPPPNYYQHTPNRTYTCCNNIPPHVYIVQQPINTTMERYILQQQRTIQSLHDKVTTLTNIILHSPAMSGTARHPPNTHSPQTHYTPPCRTYSRPLPPTPMVPLRPDHILRKVPYVDQMTQATHNKQPVTRQETLP